MGNTCSYIRSMNWESIGKYLALLSVIGMIFTPILAFRDIKLGFALAIWFSALFVLLFEFPILSKCFRADSTGEKIALAAQRPLIKGIFYIGFSTIMWVTIRENVTAVLAPAITLTLSSACLLIGVLRCKQNGSARNPDARSGNMAASTILSSNAEAGKV